MSPSFQRLAAHCCRNVLVSLEVEIPILQLRIRVAIISSFWGNITPPQADTCIYSTGAPQGTAPPSSHHGGNPQTACKRIKVVTWNIGSLTCEKLLASPWYIGCMGAGIVCPQEIHNCNSDYHVTNRGFLVILSRPAGHVHDSVGVGFFVAPWVRRSIAGCCMIVIVTFSL